MSGQPHPPEIRAEVLAYRRAHGPAAAEERFRVSTSTQRRWARDAGEEPLLPTPDPERVRQAAHEYAKADQAIPLDPSEASFLHEHPEFTDKKIARLDVWETFAAVEAMQEVVGGSGTGQHDARVSIPATEPIILLPTADWHMGSYATTHAELREYLQRVMSIPGCYLLLLGDHIDNFQANFKSAAAVFSQVIPPQIQRRLFGKILRELVAKGKVVARTWGNHDSDFSERVAGGIDIDGEELLPYLKTMGRLYLTVGDTEYRVFASHTFPGKSYLHVGHQNKRAVRMLWPEAHIVLSGHTHSGPEHEQFWHGDQPVVSATCGTAKTDDTYSKRYYGRSRWSDQALVLHHDTMEVVPFRTLDQALIYRDGWRARQKRAA